MTTRDIKTWCWLIGSAVGIVVLGSGILPPLVLIAIGAVVVVVLAASTRVTPE